MWKHGWMRTRRMWLLYIAEEERVVQVLFFSHIYFTFSLCHNTIVWMMQNRFAAYINLTGTMICAYLLHSNQFPNPQVFWISFTQKYSYLREGVCLILDWFKSRDALLQKCMEYFGNMRTDRSAGSKIQGVETPSQVIAYKLIELKIFWKILDWKVNGKRNLFWVLLVI